MADDLSSVDFSTKRTGDDKWPATMAELVAGWISYQANEERCHKGREQDDFWASSCVWDLVKDHADLGLDFVLAVLGTDPDKVVLPVLAAGPLEDALGYHGQAIIERVEAEAERSPEFRYLLGGVWKGQMSDEIWERVLNVAPNRW